MVLLVRNEMRDRPVNADLRILIVCAPISTRFCNAYRSMPLNNDHLICILSFCVVCSIEVHDWPAPAKKSETAWLNLTHSSSYGASALFSKTVSLACGKVSRKISASENGGFTACLPHISIT